MYGSFGLLGRIGSTSLPFPDLHASSITRLDSRLIIYGQYIIIVIAPHDGQYGQIVGFGTVG